MEFGIGLKVPLIPSSNLHSGSKNIMLYVACTPIGNLAEASPRLIEVLSSCDFVLSEDTRRARKLLSGLGIQAPQIFAVHGHNEQRVAQKYISRLLNGESAVLISDAGAPTVSDPGSYLVAIAHQQGVQVSPVNGPSAVVAALSVSGFSSNPFHFLGFAPRKEGAIRRMVIRASQLECTFVVFESGKRVGRLIAILAQSQQYIIVLCKNYTITTKGSAKK